jgi:hypothetical protein
LHLAGGIEAEAWAYLLLVVNWQCIDNDAVAGRRRSVDPVNEAILAHQVSRHPRPFTITESRTSIELPHLSVILGAHLRTGFLDREHCSLIERRSPLLDDRAIVADFLRKLAQRSKADRRIANDTLYQREVSRV